MNSLKCNSSEKHIVCEWTFFSYLLAIISKSFFIFIFTVKRKLNQWWLTNPPVSTVSVLYDTNTLSWIYILNSAIWLKQQSTGRHLVSLRLVIVEPTSITLYCWWELLWFDTTEDRTHDLPHCGNREFEMITRKQMLTPPLSN